MVEIEKEDDEIRKIVGMTSRYSERDIYTQAVWFIGMHSVQGVGATVTILAFDGKRWALDILG